MVRTAKGVKKAAQDAAQNGNVLGYWAYWDCYMVRITINDFQKVVEKAGFDKNAIKDIRDCKAFTRALKQLVESDTLTRVEEDSNKIVYQIDKHELTKAKLSERVDKKISFKYEARIAIDKEALRVGQGPDAFIISDNNELKKQMIDLFKITAQTYRTEDFRKFVKDLFYKEADLIRMRKAGGLYFVPPEGKIIGEKMIKLFEMMPGDVAFDFVPMPDGNNSRRALKRAIVTEAKDMIEDLKEKVKKLDPESKKIEYSTEVRLNDVMKLRTKVEAYKIYLQKEAKDLDKELDNITKEIKSVITK